MATVRIIQSVDKGGVVARPVLRDCRFSIKKRSYLGAACGQECCNPIAGTKIIQAREAAHIIRHRLKHPSDCPFP
jgi:hypothetical protein